MFKMKNILIHMLALCLCSAMILSSGAFAADDHYELACANALYELGLFRGTGTDANGKPTFELERSANRAEALVMLIRLLGQEEAALACKSSHPFADVPAGNWAYPYVAYAYETGLTRGTGATTFTPNNAASLTEYATFLLRALGYNDQAGDFEYASAYYMAGSFDLFVPYPDDLDTNDPISRGFCAAMSVSALTTEMKGKPFTLAEQLAQEGVLDDANRAIDILTPAFRAFFEAFPPGAIIVAETTEHTENEEETGAVGRVASVRDSEPPAGAVVLNPGDSLTKAIASGKHLYLKAGTYQLSKKLVISKIHDLTIEGSSSSDVSILCSDFYDDVILIDNCQSIQLSNLTIGHGPNYGSSCVGDVLRVEQSSGVSVDDCDLFGCGLLALYAEASGVSFQNSTLRDCADGIARIATDSHISFTNCDFLRNAYSEYAEIWAFEYRYNESFTKPASLTLTNCLFEDNQNSSKISYIPKHLTVQETGCTYRNNSWGN